MHAVTRCVESARGSKTTKTAVNEHMCSACAWTCELVAVMFDAYIHIHLQPALDKALTRLRGRVDGTLTWRIPHWQVGGPAPWMQLRGEYAMVMGCSRCTRLSHGPAHAHVLSRPAGFGRPMASAALQFAMQLAKAPALCVHSMCPSSGPVQLWAAHKGSTHRLWRSLAAGGGCGAAPLSHPLPFLPSAVQCTRPAMPLAGPRHSNCSHTAIISHATTLIKLQTNAL